MLRTAKMLAAAAVVLAGTGLSSQAQDSTVQIGWTAWSDAEFVTKLAAQIIRDEIGAEVELTQTDIAPQYQGVAQGDIDLMMMAWLPNTHANYWDRVGSDVTPLGVLYSNARLGWAVPAYIPEDQLSSISDLTNDEVRQKLNGQIQGIDPGAGLMQLSEQAIDTYGLDNYELVSASGAAMTAALDRAIRNDEWIVVTAWNPHWMFGAYELRYLEDPEGVLAGIESVHAIGRKGFTTDHPEVAAFLARMFLPLEELESAMSDAQETSYEEAVNRYIEEHPDRVNYWVTGKLGTS